MGRTAWSRGVARGTATVLALAIAITPSAYGSGGDARAMPAVTLASSECDVNRGNAPAPAYGWPVKPFHRQHPVRGYFADPRIGGRIGADPMTRPRSLHFGVDVSAPDGTAVYATISGTAYVRVSRKGRVTIFGRGGVAFSYWHVRPAVRHGQRVIAYRTVVGHIADGWGHVHFAERRAGVYVNPLRRGAMGPYRDATCPVLVAVTLERRGAPVDRDSGKPFDIVVDAFDSPAMTAPGLWLGLPVTPAVVRWRIVDDDGKAAVAWRVAHDARLRLPAASYDDIYAVGTDQNYPGRAGKYRFLLARDIDPATLAGGSHSVEVSISDTAGNRTRGFWPLLVNR